jgi:hypothetical protein
MHTKAFGEMSILIYGQDPMVPMKLEQSFAKVRPSDEVNIDSFEDYNQCYDFAKEKKNIGLVFLLENCGDLTLNSVFDQFVRTQEESLVTFGIIVHNGTETFKGLRALKSHDKFISYYSVEELLDETKAHYIMQEIWQKYQEEYEKILISAPLAQTYRSMALHFTSPEEIHFKDRVCTMLTSQMNVSWLENMVLKWYPVLSTLEKHEPHLLTTNENLYSLYKSMKTDQTHTCIETIANHEMPITHKITNATDLLYTKAHSKELHEYLKTTMEKVSPRSKAMLRILKKSQDQVISFATNIENKKSMLKVV